MSISNAKVLVSDLCFSLYRRVVHPELFNIYAKQRLLTEQYEVFIWVTGCSHVVSIISGGGVLTEVISSPGQMLPKGGLIEQFKLCDNGPRRCALSSRVSYMCDVKIERISADSYRQTHLDLERFAGNRGIFTRFPKLAEGELEPFSYVDFEARRDELQIHTFAAYPGQRTIVKTQSRVGF